MQNFERPTKTYPPPPPSSSWSTQAPPLCSIPHTFPAPRKAPAFASRSSPVHPQLFLPLLSADLQLIAAVDRVGGGLVLPWPGRGGGGDAGVKSPKKRLADRSQLSRFPQPPRRSSSSCLLSQLCVWIFPLNCTGCRLLLLPPLPSSCPPPPPPHLTETHKTLLNMTQL